MASSREIRRKIKSIRATRQITRAMELVAAAKMKKAVHAATSMRTYASTALLILNQLAAKAPSALHPLLAKRPVRRVLVLVFSSDRGLCGGFNTLLFKKLLEFEKSLKRDDALKRHDANDIHADIQVDYLPIGKRAQDFLARTGRNIVLAFPAMTNNPKLSDIRPIGKYVMDAYTAGDYDEIALLYQHFFSALSQKPTVFPLLPFSQDVLMEMGANLGLFKHFDDGERMTQMLETDYLFEPSPEAILQNLLPQLTQMQIFQAAQETTASEHSARMLAMRNATDNASTFIEDLTLHLNQVRQAAITSEIAEISAGKIALGL